MDISYNFPIQMTTSEEDNTLFNVFYINFSVHGKEVIIALDSVQEENVVKHSREETTQHVLVANDSGLISDDHEYSSFKLTKNR